MPRSARSVSASSSAREKVVPSPVPWISASRPVPVATTFMSTSARASSSYGRSSRGRPPTRPTETAAIESSSGSRSIAPRRRSRHVASASAVQAPVTEAVRVPPSAWSTSQSTQSVRSPSAFASTTERRLRPISRWISSVRPDGLPRLISRSVRRSVEPGRSEYSAVTQPRP
jgi:hypothetical protein